MQKFESIAFAQQNADILLEKGKVKEAFDEYIKIIEKGVELSKTCKNPEIIKNAKSQVSIILDKVWLLLGF